MSDPKDNPSFLRKVVRFVANPATDWHELNSPQDRDVREVELEKSELKAMIERKRRNDFVRKREFDMLRRIRREGLTAEQVAALGSSSRLDEIEGRAVDSQPARSGGGVKAKIDEIEQQMVSENFEAAATRRSTSFFGAVTEPAPLLRHAIERRDPIPGLPGVPSRLPDEPDELRRPAPPLPDLGDFPAEPGDAAPKAPAAGMAPLPTLTLSLSLPGGPPAGLAVEVSEVQHDPDLDEAVIAFANADFDQCEQALVDLTAPSGPRATHAETWLVLFDLFRAIGAHQRFENLALEYAQQFGWSAPQWYSLPQLVADAAAEDRPQQGRAERIAGEVGWVAPEILDIDALSRLRSLTLQMPLPWVFDWSGLRSVSPEAATQLSVLCRMWALQSLEMRWLDGERLFAVLQEAAPTGARAADPAFWLARLDTLRLADRVDEFEEAAIDYCVTYEVSPPSWEPARCTVEVGNQGETSLPTPSLSVIGEISTSFLETEPDEGVAVEVVRIELSGQLVGDISETLQRLTGQLGSAPVVSVSCALLIRVDFLAAGDLLNWVLSRRSESRTVQFTEAHRLVALFFTAMGIGEHAQVHIRKV